MKNSIFIFLIIFASCTTIKKDDIQNKGFQQAKEMTELYNSRDIPKYVDFLLPSYYGNDSATKSEFVKIWEMILKQDTANFELIGNLKLIKSENQYQSLFQVNFRDNKNYIIGISDDEGETWKFSTVFNENMKFDQLLENIPSLDLSFSELIDKNYGKRIQYKVGESILPFNYTDIDGNELSSKSLKGSALILNFWYTSCAPCINEIPELNELVKKYDTDELKFIAPAVLTDMETVNHFLTRNDFLYDIVLVDADDYVISSYPTHIIIDKNHKVKDIITGYSEDNLRKLEKAINDIL